MAQVQYIKALYENEEKSLREISRITGHSFETVQKYAQKENWNEDNLPDTEPTSYPVLDEFIPIVDGWLEADRKVPRKQRHTAWRLFCRLRDEYGFRGQLLQREAICPQEEVCDESPKRRVSSFGTHTRMRTSGFRGVPVL